MKNIMNALFFKVLVFDEKRQLDLIRTSVSTVTSLWPLIET